MRSSFATLLSGCFFLVISDAFHLIGRTSSPANLYASPIDSPLENNLERDDDFNKNSQTKFQFRKLLEESLAITNPDHLPRLLANNMEVIISLQGEEGARIVAALVDEAKAESEEHFKRTILVVDNILSFAETFVEKTIEIDDSNKKLLGKIVKTMTLKKEGSKEDALDELMEAEKDNFSAGFLRHLEGECKRISNAPQKTPEATRLLEIIRIIQARVLEELGVDMGEAALVLGQLMGYDNKDELLGVLDAGLTVQGKEFAVEMSSLTEEALNGFQSVHGGVEPELIERVTFVDQRLKEYLDENNNFQ
jgi:hypothetical protein